jgi:hypothetical protein
MFVLLYYLYTYYCYIILGRYSSHADYRPLGLFIILYLLYYSIIKNIFPSAMLTGISALKFSSYL